MSSYYNTTNLNGTELKKRRSKADSQDKIILSFFREHKRRMTASEVWINAFNTDEVPITSVRRSISTLNREGKILKTNERKQGIYGASEYLWEINNLMPKI